MARMSLEDKCQRMVRFLLALQRRPVAAELARFGFDRDTHERAWSLLRAAIGSDFEPVELAVPETRELALLDEWEGKWYPIASATLAANFPATHARVFRNLSRTSGLQLVPSILILLERIEALAEPAASEQDRAAHALLAKRGLNHERLQEAQDLLTRLRTIKPAGDEDEEERLEAERKVAEAALWSFYKEWAEIARVGIRSRKILKELGFRQEATATKGSAAPPASAGGQAAAEDGSPMPPRVG